MPIRRDRVLGALRLRPGQGLGAVEQVLGPGAGMPIKWNRVHGAAIKGWVQVLRHTIRVSTPPTGGRILGALGPEGRPGRASGRRLHLPGSRGQALACRGRASSAGFPGSRAPHRGVLEVVGLVTDDDLEAPLLQLRQHPRHLQGPGLQGLAGRRAQSRSVWTRWSPRNPGAAVSVDASRV